MIFNPIMFLYLFCAESEINRVAPAIKIIPKKNFKCFCLLVRTRNETVRNIARIGPFLANIMINMIAKSRLREYVNINGSEVFRFNSIKGQAERSSNDAPAGRGLSENRRIFREL